MVDPPPTMTTEVTVLLEDVNDETPTFKAAHYVAEIAEGAQFNSPVNLIGDAIPEVYDHDQVRTPPGSRRRPCLRCPRKGGLNSPDLFFFSFFLFWVFLIFLFCHFFSFWYCLLIFFVYVFTIIVDGVTSFVLRGGSVLADTLNHVKAMVFLLRI